jgi:hypothetical protein
VYNCFYDAVIKRLIKREWKRNVREGVFIIFTSILSLSPFFYIQEMKSSHKQIISFSVELLHGIS